MQLPNWKSRVMRKAINKELSILSLILLLSLGLRLYKIDNPLADWHSWRQADTASVSRTFAKNGINVLYPKFDDLSSIASGIDNPQGYRYVEFPISNALHAALSKIFNKTDFVKLGRLISVAYSLISIIFIFWLVKFHTNTQVAFISAFLLAVLPFNVYYSRTILPETFLSMVIIVSLLCFSYYAKNPNKKFFLLSVISFAVVLLTKAYMGVIFFPLVVNYLKFNKINRASISKLLLFLLISALPFIAWFLWARQFPSGIPHFSWVFNGDGIRFRPSFFYWIFSVRIGTLILGTWGVALLVAGLISSAKNKNWFFVSWWLSILMYIFVVATGNVRHDYYQVVTVAPIVVFCAIGIVDLWKRGLTSQIITAFSIFMMLLIGSMSVRGYYQINHWEIIEAGKAADRLLPLSAKVIAPYQGDTAFLYQINRQGWPYVTYPIEDLIERGATHYVSVNYDEQTRSVMGSYTVLEENPRYVIVELVRK
jgi:hypothetical protein